MSWPIKLRAMSFAITMGVTLTESIMSSIPIGFAFWYFHLASTRAILESVAVLVAAISFSISIYSHLLPARYSRSLHKESAL